MLFRVKMFSSVSIVMPVGSQELLKGSCDESLNVCPVCDRYPQSSLFGVDTYLLLYIYKKPLHVKYTISGCVSHELASSHIFAANRIQNHVETNQHSMILLQYIASPLWWWSVAVSKRCRFSILCTIRLSFFWGDLLVDTVRWREASQTKLDE